MPLQDPDAAADELERAVTKPGLKAALGVVRILFAIDYPVKWMKGRYKERLIILLAII